LLNVNYPPITLQQYPLDLSFIGHFLAFLFPHEPKLRKVKLEQQFPGNFQII